MTETNRRAFLIHAGLGASSLVVGSGCLTPDCDPAVSPCGLPPEPPEPTDPPRTHAIRPRTTSKGLSIERTRLCERTST